MLDAVSNAARHLKAAAAIAVLAALVAACAPGRPYVQTVDDQNRLLYAPEAGF